MFYEELNGSTMKNAQLKKVCENKITNIELVDIIDNYGVDIFFIDLKRFLKKNIGSFWMDLYCSVSISYHEAKKYFNEH